MVGKKHNTHSVSKRGSQKCKYQFQVSVKSIYYLQLQLTRISVFSLLRHTNKSCTFTKFSLTSIEGITAMTGI